MKTVILCGGLGSRLSEETKLIPKPMVKIGSKPILVHIMNRYYKYGFKDFFLATGYKSEIIERYFKNKKFPYKITCVFTGKKTLTGSRIKRLKHLFKPKENFMMTYGDGLIDSNLKKLLNHHVKCNKIATITAVRQPARFGELKIRKNSIVSFQEKVQFKDRWINGGYFVLNYEIFKYIDNINNIVFEKQPIKKLIKNKEIVSFKHKGFWQCMDTLREKEFLQKLYLSNSAPWLK